MNVLGGPDGAAAKAWQWTYACPTPHATAKTFASAGSSTIRSAPSRRRSVPRSNRPSRPLKKAGALVDRGWPEGVDPQAQFLTYQYLLASVMLPFMPPEAQQPYRELYKMDPTHPFGAALVEPHTRWVHETLRRFAARAAWQTYFEIARCVSDASGAWRPRCCHDHSEPQYERMIQTPDGSEAVYGHAEVSVVCSCSQDSRQRSRSGRIHQPGGLPVGIQIIGPYLEDATPIEFAARLTEVIGGFQPPKGYSA